MFNENIFYTENFIIEGVESERFFIFLFFDLQTEVENLRDLRRGFLVLAFKTWYELSFLLKFEKEKNLEKEINLDPILRKNEKILSKTLKD